MLGGLIVFKKKSCDTCHAQPVGSDSQSGEVRRSGTPRERGEGQEAGRQEARIKGREDAQVKAHQGEEAQGLRAEDARGHGGECLCRVRGLQNSGAVPGPNGRVEVPQKEIICHPPLGLKRTNFKEHVHRSPF